MNPEHVVVAVSRVALLALTLTAAPGPAFGQSGPDVFALVRVMDQAAARGR